MRIEPALALALALLGGCGGGSPGVGPDPAAVADTKSEDLGPFDSNSIKISYFRFLPVEEFQQTGEKTHRHMGRKIEPAYWVLRSESWYRRHGDRTYEPFTRAFPEIIPARDTVPDAEMRYYAAELLRLGYLALPEMSLNDLSVEWLRKMRSGAEWNQVSVIAIQTDKIHRLVCVHPFRNDKTLVQKFIRVEVAAQQMTARARGYRIRYFDK